MKLESQYQNILDSAFSHHFPEWGNMSPLDPMKVLAESLATSLSEIERRQSRFTNTVLDCLPSLFSFEPRRASLPTGLFGFKPSSRLSHSQKIGPEAVFRFESATHSVLVTPSHGQTVSPVLDLDVTREGKRYVIRFRQPDGEEPVRLYFLAGHEGTERLENLSVRVQDAGNRHEFCREDLLVVDSTDGLNQSGLLSIEPIHGRFGSGLVEIEVEITVDTRAAGGFFANLIECTYFEEEEFVELGSIKGEPWEEITLDPAILTPPAELHIHFPDDHSLRIRRIDSDILKLHHANYERFSNSFFYNGVNHSLILPSAHRLVQRYTGGVTLLAPRVQKAPQCTWLDAEYEGSTGEYATMLEEIFPVRPLTGFSPRENKLDYLRRFYGAIRSFAAGPPSDREFIPEQLKAAIIALDQRIKAVELKIDPVTKHITIFVLTRYPSSAQDLGIEPEVREAIARYATEAVPLEFDWSVRPFQVSEPSIQLSTEIQLDGTRMGLVGSEVLKAKIQSKLSHLLLPPPFGFTAAERKVSKEALLADLLKRLTAPQGDNSHLRRTEVKSLHGLIVHGDSSRFETSLTREPGQLFLPKIEIEARIRCTDGMLEDFAAPAPRKEAAHV